MRCRSVECGIRHCNICVFKHRSGHVWISTWCNHTSVHITWKYHRSLKTSDCFSAVCHDFYPHPSQDETHETRSLPDWWYCYPSEKYDFVRILTFPIYSKHKTYSKPPTSCGLDRASVFLYSRTSPSPGSVTAHLSITRYQAAKVALEGASATMWNGQALSTRPQGIWDDNVDTTRMLKDLRTTPPFPRVTSLSHWTYSYLLTPVYGQVSLLWS